jgi:hypothetical protein
MASTPACSSCGTNVNDFSGEVQILKIKRMISENYLMILICIIMLIILGYLIYFAIKKIVNSVSVYNKALNKTNVTPTEDSENYDTSQVFNPIAYFEPGKAEFVGDFEKRYNEYNQTKTDYIKSTYERQNDDIIDKSVLYKTNDNYDYSSES